jgi:ribosomal protein S6--L-glutamate ligase
MKNNLNVLSYHLLLETNNNRPGAVVDASEIAAMKKADAIILPQGCKKELYQAARRHCSHVFPDYDAFYRFPGKTGQIDLFQQFKVPHPASLVFATLASFKQQSSVDLLNYPVVFKFSWGGEGRNVFLLENEDQLNKCLQLSAKYEKEEKRGFIIQEYIPVNGRSLRVVVMADKFISYWRCHEKENNFYSNLARGAVIDRYSEPEMQEAAIRELKKFCAQSKINLAGFDFIFDPRQARPVPLFLEINYFFRCHGLGGPDGYLQLLVKAVREWLSRINSGKTV